MADPRWILPQNYSASGPVTPGGPTDTSEPDALEVPESADPEGPEPSTDALGERILRGLALGLKYPAVAKVAKCSARTVQRRMESPEFRMRVRVAQDEIDDEIYGRALAASTLAMDTVDASMDPAEPMTTRLAGARLALRTTEDARARRHLSERVEELEQVVQELIDVIESVMER